VCTTRELGIPQSDCPAHLSDIQQIIIRNFYCHLSFAARFWLRKCFGLMMWCIQQVNKTHILKLYYKYDPVDEDSTQISQESKYKFHDWCKTFKYTQYVNTFVNQYYQNFETFFNFV
jgi:hypothetical protein